jgi:hypothetical protein
VGRGYAAAVALLCQIIESIQVLSGELSVLKRAMLVAEWEPLCAILYTIKGYQLLLTGEIGIHLERSSVPQDALKYTG